MMKNLGTLLAIASTCAVLGLTANVATLTFDTPADCNGPDVVITQGSPESTCVGATLVTDSEGLLAVGPDDSFWTARFATAVASVSIDLGDYGADADATFLAVYDAKPVGRDPYPYRPK